MVNVQRESRGCTVNLHVNESWGQYVIVAVNNFMGGLFLSEEEVVGVNYLPLPHPHITLHQLLTTGNTATLETGDCGCAHADAVECVVKRE